MSSESSGIDYAAVLADLEAKRAQLDAAIAGIRVMLGKPVSGAAASSSVAVGGNGIEIAPDAFFGLSIPDATKKYLGMRKRTATSAEIIDALKKGGQPNSSGDSFANTVGSVLNRTYQNGAGIVRVSRGIWGLADWYPNKPRKPVAKASESDDEVDPTE